MTRILCLALVLALTGCVLPLERGARWHPDPHWGDRGLRRY